MTQPTAREQLLDVISFTECCNSGTTPDALLDAYRDHVLADGAEILKARHDDVFDAAGGGVAAGLLIGADLLLAARSAQTPQEPQ